MGRQEFVILQIQQRGQSATVGYYGLLYSRDGVVGSEHENKEITSTLDLYHYDASYRPCKARLGGGGGKGGMEKIQENA